MANLNMHVESLVDEQPLSEAEDIRVTIEGPKEDVMFLVEAALVVQSQLGGLDVESVQADGEELYANRT